MINLLVVIAYVVATLAVGWWGMRRTKTVDDFFLGGRNLGPWLSAFAYGTTYFSAVLFIGYAGKLGWGFGLYTMFIVLGNAFIGCYLAWHILASRTRAMTGRLNARTMPEFLEARYESRFLKILAALVIFVFLVPYTASVYMGLSYLFEINMHIPYEWALGFMALLTGVYLIMGGYLALAVTDLIRGVIEFVGVAIMVTYLTGKAGGFLSAISKLAKPEHAPALYAPGPIPGWLTLLALVCITSFGPWALPQMVQKFYSIKSEAHVRATKIMVTIFALVMSFGAYFTGALTRLFYDKLPVPKIDQLMPHFLTEHTPPVVAIIILLLVFSASMSSLSSLVLVSSSAIAIDLYGGVLRPNASRNSVLMWMRVLCGVFVGCSLAIALIQPTFIVNLMIISWGVLSGAFLAPLLYGLFWKNATKAGATTAMIVGITVAVVLYWKLGEKGVPVAGMLAMIIPCFVLPAVSAITTPPSKATLAQAFGTDQSEVSNGAEQA